MSERHDEMFDNVNELLKASQPGPSAPPADPTLHARVEALSAALREMDAAAEQTIRTFDCDGRNYSLTRRLREAREAARKALEGK